MMRRRRLALGGALAIAVVTGLFAASAGATRFVAGKLILDFRFNFAPRQMPRHEDVGIRFFGDAKLSMTDGSYPPVATDFEAEFDKSGRIETEGLARCPRGRLEATTTVQAREACPSSIVGKGSGEGVVLFPEQGPIEVSSPITIFNGPRLGGAPTAIAHAYLTVPTPSAILVVFRIKRIHDRYYGTRLESDIPEIAGGAGSVTGFRFGVNRRWTYKGRELSYLNAHCPHPGPHRLARANIKFTDGTDLSGSIFTSCSVREG